MFFVGEEDSPYQRAGAWSIDSQINYQLPGHVLI